MHPDRKRTGKGQEKEKNRRGKTGGKGRESHQEEGELLGGRLTIRRKVNYYQTGGHTMLVLEAQSIHTM